MADKPVRADKATAVAELTEHFRNSTATVLTEYRGLTVAQLTELRRSLGGQTKYSVRRTRSRSGRRPTRASSGLDELFTGPTALAFVSGDPVEAAKGLRDFAEGPPAPGHQGRRLRGQGHHGGRGQQARRPRVPRGAAGQAGRRHEGQPEQGRGACSRPRCRRPPAWLAALQDKREKDGAAEA